MESAKAFIEKMNTDEDFRKKVVECKDSDERKSYVSKEGFEFEVEELKMTRSHLSDHNLNSAVAGSGDCNPDWSGAYGWMLFDFIH